MRAFLSPKIEREISLSRRWNFFFRDKLSSSLSCKTCVDIPNELNILLSSSNFHKRALVARNEKWDFIARPVIKEL